MGVYYHSKNKKVKDLLPNYSGADFYGLLYRFAVEGRTDDGFYDPMPRLPYSATAAEAKAMAEKIHGAIKTDGAAMKKYLESYGALRHLPTDDEKNDLIASLTHGLVKFLRECGGYEAD